MRFCWEIMGCRLPFDAIRRSRTNTLRAQLPVETVVPRYIWRGAALWEVSISYPIRHQGLDGGFRGTSCFRAPWLRGSAVRRRCSTTPDPSPNMMACLTGACRTVFPGEGFDTLVLPCRGPRAEESAQHDLTKAHSKHRLSALYLHCLSCKQEVALTHYPLQKKKCAVSPCQKRAAFRV
jgi:hypothetical protein